MAKLQTQGGAARERAVGRAEAALKTIEGRWKLVILSHLFERPVMRFSELARAIPNASQKMLIQQLRDLEGDGIVERTVYPEVPPKVEYRLTPLGEALCPALQALLDWAALRETQGKPSAKAKATKAQLEVAQPLRFRK
jgi:DNA-binding HxlR family transcriptional regulator